jgi:hypothetical protein
MYMCDMALNFPWNKKFFGRKYIEKIKTSFYIKQIFNRELYCLWDNMETCCTAGQATDDNIVKGECCECWISKTKKTHPEYVILMLSHGKNYWTNAPRYYVIRTFPVLLCACFLVPRKRNLSDCVYTGELKWEFLVEVDRRVWGHFMCDSDCISNSKSSSLSPQVRRRRLLGGNRRNKSWVRLP